MKSSVVDLSYATGVQCPEPAWLWRAGSSEPCALVEPFFVVLFECGGHLSFQCALDAIDAMNTYEGAYATIRLPGKALIAVPKPLDYSAIWNRKTDPQWRSL